MSGKDPATDQMQTDDDKNAPAEGEESEEKKREREEQERQLQLIVAKYLQQRGFHKAFEAFQQDAINLGDANLADFTASIEREGSLQTGTQLVQITSNRFS
jgi:hypothetical protein